ncbi:MAG: Asd/ArgC dimerization domain-containing protein [Terriglobia bacterium]
MGKRAVQKGFRVAIVGATSLRGKELKELLAAGPLPVEKLTLLDDDEALGQLTDYEGEPTFLQTIAPETFQAGELVFFASTTPDFTRKHWHHAAAAHAVVIDLSHALLDEPGVTVRVAFLPKHQTGSALRCVVAPHPVVVVLLALLLPLHERFGLVRAVANVFEPVSERGLPAMDELQEQTVQLLSFQELPRAVFDAQLAFNLLAGYGSRSRLHLEEIESVVARELERCAPELAARTALRFLQAPVFHGLAVSLWADFEHTPGIVAVETALEGPRVRVTRQDVTAPTVSDSAGCEDILVGPIVQDRSRTSAVWLWAVADNLRLAARNALELAQDLAT